MDDDPEFYISGDDLYALVTDLVEKLYWEGLSPTDIELAGLPDDWHEEERIDVSDIEATLVLLRRNWPAVVKVAQVLASEGAISGWDVSAILNEIGTGDAGLAREVEGLGDAGLAGAGTAPPRREAGN